MKIPTITGSSNIPRSENRASGSGQPKDNGELLPGRLLKAKVITGTSPDGKVLLELAGRQVSAKSMVKLAAGDTIWLEVNQHGSTPLLAPAPQKGAVQNFLQALFTDPQGPDNLIGRILSLLSQLPPESRTQPTISTLPARLAMTIQGGKADPDRTRLMALLFGGTNDRGGQGLQQLKEQSGLEKFSAAAQKLLSEGMEFVDRHQQINAGPPGRDDSLFLFPCFFREESGWGEWVFSKTEKRGSGTSFELDFFLDMSKLGPLSLHISCDGEKLTGGFHLSGGQVLDYMEKRIPELEKILQGLGFRSVCFQCRLSRESVLMGLKNSLMKKAGLKHFSLVDVSA